MAFYPSKAGDGNGRLVELVGGKPYGHHEFTYENCDVTYVNRFGLQHLGSSEYI